MSMRPVFRRRLGRKQIALVSVTIFFSTQYASGLEISSGGASDTASASTTSAPASPRAGEEIVEKRTRTSKTFARERRGEYTTVLTSGSIHYTDEHGGWRDIETTLVDDGKRLRNKANSFKLEIDKDSRAPRLASIRLDDAHAVGFGVKNAKAAANEKQIEKIVFKETLAGVDLELDSTASGLKEAIVLKNRNAQNVFDFPLDLEGLSASLDSDGNVVYRDGDGVERLRTPRGFMVDSNVDPFSGEAARSDDVMYELLTSGGATTLRVTASRQWLDAPERRYPVTIDPSFWLSTPWDDDMFVAQGWNNDFSNDPELKVGRALENGVLTPLHQSYMHFQVNGLDGKVIDDATFFILNTWSWACGAGAERGVGGYRITQPWNGHQMRSTFPDALPQGNQIVWGAFAMGHDPCGDGWAFWNVTDAVRNWTSNAWEEHGIGMRVDIGSESDYYAWKRFASWNTPLTLSQCPIPVPTEANNYLTKCMPHIDIHWHEPNRRPDPPFYIQPSANATLNYPDPSLVANNNDPDGNNVALRFRLYREADGAYMGGKDGGWICSGCQDSWYAGPLRDGRYFWDEWAWDGQYDSSIARNYFTIAVPPDVPTDLNPGSGTVGQTAPNLSGRYYDRNGAQDPDGGALDFEVADANYQRIELKRIVAMNNQIVSHRPVLPEGRYNWRVSAWDGVYPSSSATAWREFTVDTTAPVSPDVLDSTTHPVSFPFPPGPISMKWSPGADALSGLQGYSWSVTNSSVAPPYDGTVETNTTAVTTQALAAGNWWFHVRPVDMAGNAGSDVAYGPVTLDSAAVALPRIPISFSLDDRCTTSDAGYYDASTCAAPPHPSVRPAPETLDASRSLYGYVGPYYSPVVPGNSVVVLQTSIRTTTNGSWSAWGLIRNETPASVGTAVVTAKLYDKKNVLLATVAGTSPVTPIRAHEPAPFSITSAVLASKVTRVDYTVATTAAASATRQVRLANNLTLEYGNRTPYEGFGYSDTGTGPYPEVRVGSFVNEATASLNNPTVVGVWLDGAGKVLWVQSAAVQALSGGVLPSLGPGMRGEYDIVVSDPAASTLLASAKQFLLWGTTR